MRKEPTDEAHIRLRFSEYIFLVSRLAENSSSAVLLYLTILKWQRAGYFSKSLTFLARECGLSRQTVNELIKKFLHLKILKKLHTSKGERSEYELLDFATATQEQPDEQSEKIHANKPNRQSAKRQSDDDIAAAAAAKRRTERESAASDNLQANQKISEDCRATRAISRRVG